MSIVYQAIDPQLNREVAVKVLGANRLEHAGRERFLREARAIAAIRHPHVIIVYDASITADGIPYLVMELAFGSLQDRIRDEVAVPAREAARILAEVADGLAAVHAAGYVHRDIKPANILLACPEHHADATHADGDTMENSATRGIPRLADFGLARASEQELTVTRTGVLPGTPAYISPEQLADSQDANASSDIYALGVTLYETITGTLPFRGTPHAILQQIANEEPIAPRRLDPAIPVDLETICLKAMHKHPASRYASAGAFAADLQRWLRGEPIQARPTPTIARIVHWSRRNRRVAALTLISMTLLAVLAAGATAAAWRIQTANRQLLQEKQAADRAREEAQIAAVMAGRQRALALESLELLIHRVQQQLGARPGTLRLREELLQTARQGLERVVDSTNQAQVDHATISAQLRIAEIAQALGHTDQASQEAARAKKLAEDAYAANPDDPQLAGQLAQALTFEAEFHQRAFAFEQARPRFQRALELRLRLAERNPDDPVAQQAVIVCRQRLADILRYQGQHSESERQFEELRVALIELCRRFPGDFPLERSLCLVRNRIGMLRELAADLTTAETYYRQSADQIIAFLDREPKNPLARQDAAFTQSRIASVVGKMGRFPEAISVAKDARERYRQIAEDDLDDTEGQVKWAANSHALYELCLAHGDLAAAADALSESMRVYRPLVDKFPSSSRFSTLAAEIASKQADVELRRGDFSTAVQFYYDAQQLLDRCRQAADYSAEALAPLRRVVDFTCASLVSYQSRAAVVSDDWAPRSETDMGVVALQMYRHALRGDADEVIASGRRLRALAETDEWADADLALFLAARAAAAGFARLHATLPPSLLATQNKPAPGNSTDTSAAELLELCCGLSRSVLPHNPKSAGWFAADPDFDALRNRPEFQAAITADPER
jgi:tetratricopeptide (TPR) repeat protein